MRLCVRRDTSRAEQSAERAPLIHPSRPLGTPEIDRPKHTLQDGTNKPRVIQRHQLCRLLLDGLHFDQKVSTSEDKKSNRGMEGCMLHIR